MEEIADTLAHWRDGGERLIPENWREFRRLVVAAEDLTRGKHYAAAAAYGELAALYAISRHCGIFVSPALERVLIDIGKKAIAPSARSKGRRLQYPPRRILHVSTRVMPVGGHSRMIWRWIQQDEGRVHSLALTRQTSAIPAMLKAAVADSGGRIYRVNCAVWRPHRMGEAIARGRRQGGRHRVAQLQRRRGPLDSSGMQGSMSSRDIPGPCRPYLLARRRNQRCRRQSSRIGECVWPNSGAAYRRKEACCSRQF